MRLFFVPLYLWVMTPFVYKTPNGQKSCSRTQNHTNWVCNCCKGLRRLDETLKYNVTFEGSVQPKQTEHAVLSNSLGASVKMSLFCISIGMWQFQNISVFGIWSLFSFSDSSHSGCVDSTSLVWALLTHHLSVMWHYYYYSFLWCHMNAECGWGEVTCGGKSTTVRTLRSDRGWKEVFDSRSQTLWPLNCISWWFCSLPCRYFGFYLLTFWEMNANQGFPPQKSQFILRTYKSLPSAQMDATICRTCVSVVWSD